MPASQLRVTVLGPVLVEGRSGALVEPGGRLAKALITVLTLSDGRPVSASALIDELWDDTPPTGAKAALQTLVSRVRSVAAPGLIESSSAGYRLAVERSEVDLHVASVAAEAASTAIRAEDPTSADGCARDALRLWTGEPGAELDDRVAADLVGRAAKLQDTLRRIRAQSRLDLGDGAAVVSDLEALTAADPLDDAAHLMLFNAYAQTGRRTDAMRLFAEHRARLQEQLGTDPASALVAAHTALLQDEVMAAAPRASAPPVDRAASLVLGLRTAPNALIGRDADLAAVETLVADTRMTTILGPGGLGKTRLAQEVARRAASTIPGVVFVELASVRDDEDLPLAVATALGIREPVSGRRLGDTLSLGVPSIDLRERIISRLSERPTLLVMDNCEHLVDAAARWIAELLDWTTQLRVLATSRSPLSIAAEHVYQLAPLGADAEHDAAGPAVQLFIERAKAARPGIIVPLDAAARLCAKLDGLPLAIELAAARTRSMSVHEVERRLGNRFALLTAGDRSAPERHRTLLAVIDWSWNLLGARERTVLRRMSRFPDGFGIDAAVAVTGDAEAAEALDALVGQSLLTAQDDPATGTLRFRMLETVREFGAIVLDEAHEAQLVMDRTRAWATGLSTAMLSELQGPEQLAAFARVALEQDTLVSILREALTDRRSDIVGQIFATLALFWTVRSAHQEVLAFGEAVLDVIRHGDPDTVDGDGQAVSLAIVAVTFLASDHRVSARAIGALRRVERQQPTRHPRLGAMVGLVLSAGRAERVEALLREYARSTDPQIANLGNLMASQAAENDGDPRTAEAAALRANELSRSLGDTWGSAMSAHMLAQLRSQSADPEYALVWAGRAAEGFSALGADADLRQLEWLIALGDIARGDFDAATAVLDRFLADEVSFSAFAPLPERRSIGWAGLAEIARAQGESVRGAELYGKALVAFSPGESRRSPWFTLVASAALAAALLDGIPGDEVLTRLARRVRTRTVALGRLLPGRFDKPVLGSTVLALGSWYARSGTADIRLIGAELVALAERLASRQDIPSLVRAPHETSVRDRISAPEAEAIAARIDPLSAHESAARALELLGSTSLATL